MHLGRQSDLDERELNVLACTAPARISMFLAVDIGFPITNLVSR